MKNHIYIHFPYCLYKCHYCDFNSHARESNDIPANQYVKSLINEIDQRVVSYGIDQKHCYAPGTKIDSIFFGGGTPSLMTASHIEQILDHLLNSFDFTPATEITLEANPGTLTLDKCNAFALAGINRLSMGIQSFQDQFLARFGRIHTGVEAQRALQVALESNIKEVSADLIFGFPDQSLNEWQADLKKLLEYPLNHFSAYALTNEEGTLFHSQVQKQEIGELDPDLVATMLEKNYAMAEGAGYTAYEISNFAKPGFESRHNLGYWQSDSFLGLGAGAWGQFLNGGGGWLREMNVKLPETYMRLAADGEQYQCEAIPPEVAMGEFLMMGLRLREGVSLDGFEKRFGLPLSEVFSGPLQQSQKESLVKLSETHLVPTNKGLLFNNYLVSMYLAPTV